MRVSNQMKDVKTDWIQLIVSIVIVFVMAVAVIFTVVDIVQARGAWPTVAELENGLSAVRGGMLPKQVVTSEGVFNGYYVGASAKGNGRYFVEIQLTR
jgi:uncharacterized membrane protein